MLKSIKYVAVVTPHYRTFKRYKNNNVCLGVEYKHIKCADDVDLIFSRRVLLYEWELIEDINEIFAVLSTRIKM